MNGGEFPRHWLDAEPIADAVWQVTRPERVTKRHNTRPCPTSAAPYGSEDPCAEHVHPECRTAGCLDLHHDLLILVVDKIRAKLGTGKHSITNLGGYARTVATSQLVELKRRDRLNRGAPAKPEREDGAASRLVTEFSAIGGVRGQWLTALFRVMRTYVTRSDLAPGHWPIDGLRQERARQADAHQATDAEIRADIAYVLRRAKAVLGAVWVHTNLVAPLQRGGGHVELHENLIQVHTDPTDTVMGKLLLAAYRRHKAQGLSHDVAFTATVRQICGVTVPRVTSAMNQAFRELEEHYAD